MSIKDHLVEQHYIEHESRLKHIDELINSAHDKIGAVNVSDEAKLELQEIKEARNKLEKYLLEKRTKLDQRWEQNAVQDAGPMGIWDIVAQRVEKLVEYLEKRNH